MQRTCGREFRISEFCSCGYFKNGVVRGKSFTDGIEVNRNASYEPQIVHCQFSSKFKKFKIAANLHGPNSGPQESYIP